MTTGFTDERVRDWVAAAPQRWPRWVLVGLWVAAFAASVAGDTEPCSTADLTVCGPDLTFSMSMVLCFASVVLLWWRPFVAVACAVLFAIADLTWDTVRPANVAWSVVAGAFIAYAVQLRSRVSRQRALAQAASVPLPPWPAGPQRPVRLDGPHRLMAAGAVALVLVAGGAAYGYERAVRLDAVHASRSQVVEATVLSDEDDDGNQKVRLERRPEGFPPELDVLFIDVPEIGDVVALRVDPRDPSWAHPVAEPPDRTWWVTIGLGALLLTAVLAERWVAVRVRRRQLEQSLPGSGTPVRVFTDGLDFVGLVAVDSTRGLAEFPVDERLRLDTPEHRRVAAPSEAFVVGDVRHGGWVALRTSDGLRLPRGPLSALPPGAEIDPDTFDRDPDDPLDWSEPVPLGTLPATLPLVEQVPVWRRALGALVAVGAVGVGAWLLWDDEVGLGGLGVVVGAGVALHWGLEQFADHVRVTSDGFVIGSVFSVVESPMGAVRQVRVGEDESAMVIFDDDSVLEIAPGGVDGRSLAAAIERAVESAHRRPAGTVPRSHLPWTAFAFGAGALVLLGVWLAHVLG